MQLHGYLRVSQATSPLSVCKAGNLTAICEQDRQPHDYLRVRQATSRLSACKAGNLTAIYAPSVRNTVF
jgi:hypothetical protein